MRYVSVLLPIGLHAALTLAGPAVAQEPRAEPPPRYVFVPVEKGALRLNTGTGEVSLCSGAEGAGACAPLPEQVRSGEVAAAALQDRVSALEARIAALEENSRSADSLAEEETLDRVMVLTERMMRRFFGVVRDMKEDFESGRL